MDMAAHVRLPVVRRRSLRANQEVEYAFPNDEAELERLDMQHAMMTLLLSNKLFWSPLRSDIQRVLDLGTGTGEHDAKLEGGSTYITGKEFGLLTSRICSHQQRLSAPISA